MTSKIIKFIKKHPYYFTLIILIIIVVIALSIILPIIFIKNNSSSIPGPGPGPGPGSKGKIIGAWASTIGCGDGTFNIISLGSALPQDYKTTGLTDFFRLIVGTYDSKLSDGKTKYIISVGGSNGSTDGWTSFLSNIISDPNNVLNFYNGCKCRGIVGIDFDLEQTTKDMIPSIINLVNQFKEIDNNFIVMYTILLGSEDTFANLLNTSNYDYLSLMLYNGGMYDALGSGGAGCDWDGWAELILSKGTAGCKYPKNAGCITNTQPYCSDVQSAYAKSANLSGVDPSKVLLGLIIDTTGAKLNPTSLARANQLITKYGGAGMMIWVIPGWANNNSIGDLNNMGFNIDASKCSSGGDTCNLPQNPCSDGMTETCVASACGKKVQGVTDLQCAPCGKGQTYWPCGNLNFCEAKPIIPPPVCF